MRYLRRLYVDEKTLPYVKAITGSVRRGKLDKFAGVSLVLLSDMPGASLEIVHLASLKAEERAGAARTCVGMALEREAAKNITVRILNTVLKRQGDPDIRGYFQSLPESDFLVKG